MKIIMSILLLFTFVTYSKAQSYFNDIVNHHLEFFYLEDSIVNFNGEKLKVFHDSLEITNFNKEIIKKYWEIDSNGIIINLYLEISEKKLFVIQELDTLNRLYFLYKKKGNKKVKVTTWNDDELGKKSKILLKPKVNTIRYFDGGLVF